MRIDARRIRLLAVSCRYPDTTLEGVAVEKRIVDLRSKEYDPNSIPPEWSSWLHRFRDEPPTEQEISRWCYGTVHIGHRVLVGGFGALRNCYACWLWAFTVDFEMSTGVSSFWLDRQKLQPVD